MILGATSTFCKDRGRDEEDKRAEPVEEIGIREPLPTMTVVPVQFLRTEFNIPDVEAKWDVAPESMYQFAAPGSASVMVLKAWAKSVVGWY